MGSETPKIEVRFLSLEEILPVRHAVLRAGRPLETARYDNDNDPNACHLGAFRDGKLLGVASLYVAEMPDRPGIAAIQIRGVATLPEARGTGLGTALMAMTREFAEKKGAQILWCNARVEAAEFYKKIGYEIVSDVYEIPNIGPHYLMLLWLLGPAVAGQKS